MADLPLTSPALASVPHGFWGRYGHDDSTEAGMARYRQTVLSALCAGGALAMLRQTHSADCAVVERSWEWTDRPQGDALATRRRGTVLGIVTADCAPVLLADPEAGVVGAAHAGWRGALGGVIGNTVAAMEALGARRAAIVAAIGPAISQPSYEVDAAFRDRFPASAQGFFQQAAGGRFRFDLPGFVADCLGAAGVGTIHDLARDTYAHPDLFYSYRRASHAGLVEPGRQISAIALP